MAFEINWVLLKIMSDNHVPHIYQRNHTGIKLMPYWANAPKTPSETITTVDNLQKLGGKNLMEISARIDFTEARYFVGENQDSLVFMPQAWTEVKGANGYTPTLTPSLIHFTRKEHKGFQNSVKEVTPKDLFFTTHLSKMMEAGKHYSGYIDTSIPSMVIDLIAKPENAPFIQQMLLPYVFVQEVESTLFSSLSITESRGSGGSWGGSKGESEADKIKARQEAIKALTVELFGENAKPSEYLDNPKFAVYASLCLGLPLPSNINYSF